MFGESVDEVRDDDDAGCRVGALGTDSRQVFIPQTSSAIWRLVDGDFTDIVQDSVLDSNSMPSDNAQPPFNFLITTAAWHIRYRRGLRALITKSWSSHPTNTLHLRRRCDGDACLSASILACSPPQAALFYLLHVETGWRVTDKPLRSSTINAYANTTFILLRRFHALLRCPTLSMQARV